MANCQCNYCKMKKLREYEVALHRVMSATKTAPAYTDAAKAYYIANKALNGEVSNP